VAQAHDSIEVRAFAPADRPQVLELLAQSLGREDDPRYSALYAWKHEDNVFGTSPCLIAADGERVVGVRVFMRWQFEHDGTSVDAVRAVDTATHPDYQGRGIFSRLTLAAIERVREDGVGFVFNTPNAQSRPGYLKMGWQVVGRPPVAVRPRSLASGVRMARAREPAERWSEPTSAGEPAADFVAAHGPAIGQLVESQPRSSRLRTVRSPEYFAWRYGLDFLHYRVVPSPGGADEGFAVFRVRRRGAAREVVLDELAVLGGDAELEHRVLRALIREMPGDYVIRMGSASASRELFFRLPRQGPILTWRAVCERSMPPLDAWALTMGDIELF
jgi:GNAT superfamily N-acetyltransferase